MKKGPHEVWGLFLLSWLREQDSGTSGFVRAERTQSAELYESDVLTSTGRRPERSNTEGRGLEPCSRS